MFASLFRYIQGYLKIRVTGYSPERFINLCKNKKIDVWDLQAKHNAYEMYIGIAGFRKLKPILKKTQTKVTIEGRFGLPFFFHKYRKRKLFFTGVFLCMILIDTLTFFIWDIDLQGNQTITDDVLFEFLESKEITHGMKKSKVDCEEIAKEIRIEFNDIIWVSASLQGTRLFIQVKENADTFDTTVETEEPSDIVADKAGIVKSIVTRNGVPQVKAGDEIQIEDVLVLGTVDVLNDAQEVTSHHFVKADADIVIERVMTYEEKILKKYEAKQYTEKKRRLFYLKFFGYSVQVGWKKNSFEHMEIRTSEKEMKLGDDFYLPIQTGNKTLLEYEFIPAEYSKEEMETLLMGKYERFCTELEENNATILEQDYIVTEESDGMKISATITLLEDVGISRKIIDFQ